MILFVDNCIRVDATTLLAKVRGGPTGEEQIGYWTAEWNDGGPRRRVVRLQITTTPQPLGGVRRWWRCPQCDRRCRILLAPEPDSPLACRVCWDARYVSAYPRQRRQLFRLPSRLTEEEGELAFLTAPRRRGVRRGRRVRDRAARWSRALEGSILQSLDQKTWGQFEKEIGHAQEPQSLDPRAQGVSRSVQDGRTADQKATFDAAMQAIRTAEAIVEASQTSS